MAIEQSWVTVPPRAFTANGTTLGEVNVADTAGFKVKQTVVIQSSAVLPISVQVKRVQSRTQLIVGPLPENIQPPFKQQGNSLLSVRQDISTYLIADGAFIYAVEQAKVRLKFEDIVQAIYRQEPGTTIGVEIDDQYGNPIDSIVDENGVNRLAVAGNFTAEVDVEVDVDIDGFYDPILNPDPDNIALIGHTRDAAPDQTDQIQRITTKQGTSNTDTRSMDVSVHDHSGNEFTEANPLHTKESGPTRVAYAFGTNPEHITDIQQLIWDYSANYTFLASAETLSIVSDNANDTILGSGARTVRIFGLDANYDEIDEIVNMNGVTPVLTTQQFLRRNRIIVELVGSAGLNIGNITIQGSSVQGYIPSTANRDRSVVLTVPNGYVGRLKQIYASVGPSSHAAGIKYGDLDILVGEFNGAVRTTNLGFLSSNGGQIAKIEFQHFREFPEKTDLALVFTTEKEGTATQGFLEIYLEPN